MAETVQGAQHWDAAYEIKGSAVSWYQVEPRVSLDLVRRMEVDIDVPVLDVGGGESLLVDNLLARGFVDLTVLDLSKFALAEGRRRVGPAPVTWLQADVLAWQPHRRYGLWHDRAMFHFLVDAADREAYRETLRAATVPGSTLIVATFSPEGPEACSGLPVARYSAEALAAELGESFEIVASLDELHTTPSGSIQPFTWVAGRMR